MKNATFHVSEPKSIEDEDSEIDDEDVTESVSLSHIKQSGLRGINFEVTEGVWISTFFYSFPSFRSLS